MCGLDLTSQLAVDDELVSDIRALTDSETGELLNPGAQVIADLFSHYLDRVEALGGRRLGGLHDPCAVLAVTNPELFEMEARPVGVELQGALTRGMTVVDTRRRQLPDDTGIPWDSDGVFHRVNHCARLDAGKARGLVVDALHQLGSTS